eukprot:5191112-Prymnesium_polylepis.1
MILAASAWVGRGAAGRGEAESSSKHCATSGEHMIRHLMRTHNVRSLSRRQFFAAMTFAFN